MTEFAMYIYMRSRKIVLATGCGQSHAGDMKGKKEDGGEMGL